MVAQFFGVASPSKMVRLRQKIEPDLAILITTSEGSVFKKTKF
jgi:hypothetical protein